MVQRTLLLLLAAVALTGCTAVQLRYGARLQSTDVVLNYQPDVATRVYSSAGSLISEIIYRENDEADPEGRIFVPIEAVPLHVRQAFISAEDKNFVTHSGVDWLQFAKAMGQNVGAILSGGRPRGGSTITMQTVKNFVVGSERSAERKIFEMFIAQRLERQLSKDEILERYLNENYYGNRAYGIASAALVYFDKSVRELTVPEAAVLAALPKAPSTNNPYVDPERSKARRDYVLSEMAENGFISKEEAQSYIAGDLETKRRSEGAFSTAPYFAAEVQRQMTRAYGQDFAREGYSVRSTLDEDIQGWGEQALWDGMVRYDESTSYRGHLDKITFEGDWRAAFASKAYPGLKDWDAAVVTEIAQPCSSAVRPDEAGVERSIADMAWVQASEMRTDWSCAMIETQSGAWGIVPWAGLKWAANSRGVDSSGGLLSPGDVIAVDRQENGTYRLRQVPEVGGALVAMDPHTGRVLALVGGWDHQLFPFNSATQGNRQPGSTFKPFVYLTALDSGFSPATTVFDSPVVIPQGNGETWRPRNADGQFLGQVTLRRALELSRNLATVRIAEAVGMGKVEAYAEAFGIDDSVDSVLSHSLGASETQLINVVSSYARIANGGKLIRASVVDRVQDRAGKTVYRHDQRDCRDCMAQGYGGGAFPITQDIHQQIADPATLFQLVSMMRGVMQRGTAARVGSQISCPYVAGKTGTTNDFRDAWFVGFTPDIVIGIWVGHYEFKTLGKGQYGGTIAAPIFAQFLNKTLANRPEFCVNFRTPKGITFASLNPETGLPYNEVAGEALPEAFAQGQETNCPYRDADGFCSETALNIEIEVTVTETDDNGNVTTTTANQQQTVSDDSVF